MSQRVNVISSPFNNAWQLVRLTSPDGSCQCDVHLHGAHITSYKAQLNTSREDEAFFVSKKSLFAEDKAIRGGVPICFPQFSDKGSFVMSHGFARNVEWELIDKSSDDEKSTVAILRMIKSSSYKGTHKDILSGLQQWDSVNVDLNVRLYNHQLETKLCVSNGGTDTKVFTFAFHNYFRIGNIRNIKVDGIHNNHHAVQYVDKVKKGETSTVDNSNPIEISQEVDRVYLSLLDPIESIIVEPERSREIHISQHAHSAQNVVVWNPWEDKCKAMTDMLPNEYEQFVCVETGQIQESIQLQKGQVFEAVQVISLKQDTSSKL